MCGITVRFGRSIAGCRYRLPCRNNLETRDLMSLLQQIVTKRKHERLLAPVGLIRRVAWSHKHFLCPLLFDRYVFNAVQTDAI
jgi:hypothetical protein